MKTFSITLSALILSGVGIHAQTSNASNTQPDQGSTVSTPTTYQVVDIGPHHRVWQRQFTETLANGQSINHVQSYTELASGLNYQDSSGQWQPSQAKILSFAGGAVAQQGQHQVIFANNLNSYAAVDEQTPDGKRLRSNILGLMYFDKSTMQAVQIAQLQDSEGELIADNQVLYPNAFNGVQADVLFTYRLDGLEQDVILREQPPAPEAYGMNSATTELEVFTEFLAPPPASVMDVTVEDQPDDPDQAISWGATKLGKGKAFSIDGEDMSATVTKRYATVNGRHFLLEKVKLQNIQQSLSTLPQQSSNARRLPGMASTHFEFPKGPAVKSAQRPIRMAQKTPANKGYVLDYVSLNTAYTNYTFQGDTCYYVSGNLNLSGTNNVFEGGTVIKYAASASITVASGAAITFTSVPYRPVVFTAKDDNTVGQAVTGSSGNPSGYYANPALNLSSLSSINLAEFRICYASQGLTVPGTSTLISDAQLVNCATAVSGVSGLVTLENVLLSNIKTNFNTASSVNTVSIQNATFNNAFDLVDGSYTNTTFYLTNCVFVNATNLSGTINAGHNGFYRSPSIGSSAVTNTVNPLQIAGAASCYLTNGCAFTNAGTLNIDTNTLMRIEARTTRAPVIYSNLTLSVATNYGPCVVRDTNLVPDLGYHYDPLDYVFSSVNVYSNLTFSAGTAVGWFEAISGAGYGLTIYDHVILAYNGTATTPCTMARYSTVQEGGNGMWKNLGYMGAIITASSSGGYSMNPANAGVTMPTFTRFALLCEGPNHFRENSALSYIQAQNSELWGGGVGAYWDELSATNCLFDRVSMGSTGGNVGQWWMRNCTMHGGNLTLSKYGQTWPVWIEDCAFDNTTLAVDDNSSGNTNITYCDFNGFLTSANRLPMLGAHDEIVPVLLGYRWKNSRFGQFYLPPGATQLINGGSAPAGQFGLYHFTTQTNQVPETNSYVDIGYHYVAVNTNGNPIDSNGDGNPDYLEDANGNGVVDTGETNWSMAIIVQPQSQTNVLGTNLTFSVTVVGVGPLHYQWYFNNTNKLAGATNANLTLLNVQTTNSGNYCVVITNVAGSITSSNALLTVMTWMSDIDYDGRNDAQEILDGTDPYNPASVDLVRLAHFTFDNTNTWLDDGGQLPLVATNLTSVISWSTNAVCIDTSSPAVLCYRDVETNGSANINLRDGTVRFWFKPDWSSTNMGGNGPGTAGRLIEMGSNNPTWTGSSWSVGTTNGWWALFINPAGTQLLFGSSTNGSGAVNLSANISWLSNQWHQVVLTYTPTNSLLYVDGQLATNGLAATNYPNVVERSAGFRIGSNQTGTNQARGSFDELDTFNYPLSATTIATNYQAITQIDSLGIGMPDLWQWNNFGYIGVNPNADPDGDGLSNVQEFELGTDPNQFSQERLGYWRFNDCPYWRDEGGVNPSAMQGLFPTPSWTGDAVHLAAQFQSMLAYPGLRTNGSETFACPRGSIRFWFKPDWTGTPPGQMANVLGDTVNLFESGHTSSNATYGWFGLTVNPQGNAITFSTEGSGVHSDLLQSSVQLNSNTWYQIVLTFDTNTTALYINGRQLATGPGVANGPSTNILQQGFRLGSSWDEIHQANGCFDELETFNYALSQTNILADYESAMSVLAVDGLPVIIKNGWGLRIDSWDSDCDGLPDAWEMANGLNPSNPNDATPAMIAAYAQGSNTVSSPFVLLAAPTNLINIAFVSSTNVNNWTTISGAQVRGSATNDFWNYCDANSTYLGGVRIVNAASNSAPARMYAYIGPCVTPFILPPAMTSASQWNSYCWTVTNVTVTTSPGFLVTNWDNCCLAAWAVGPGQTNPYIDCSCMPTVVASQPGITNYGTTTTTICYNTGVNATFYTNAWGDHDFLLGYNAYANPAWARDYVSEAGTAAGFSDYGAANTVFFQSWYWPTLSKYSIDITNYYNGPIVGNPYNFYYDNQWNPVGAYFLLSSDDQSLLAQGFTDASTYAATLNGYILTNGFSSAVTNCGPSGTANCYIAPFATVTGPDSGSSWPGKAGWRFSGVSQDTSGGWFKNFYPAAKRTLLINNIQNGIYSVYVYYQTALHAAPAVINGSTSVANVAPNGVKYWYGNTFTKTFKKPKNLAESLYAASPVWLMTNAPGDGYIEIDLDSPYVLYPDADIKILGVQLVQNTHSMIQALPGLETVYLTWAASASATNYNLYRAVSTTNTWTLVVATNQTSYQDTNVTVGTTYFYKVVGVDSGGSLEPSSDVVNATPFGCAAPLPPRIDYMNVLNIPPKNGCYEINMQTLLTNSDAFDPQGYPLVFKLDSVVSGLLMINGNPFGPNNYTISQTDSVVWTPPLAIPSLATPSFRVYVHDGVNRSTNVVDVLIKQTPQLSLLAWGDNKYGSVGSGYMANVSDDDVHFDYYLYSTWAFVAEPFVTNLLQLQAGFGVLAQDSRWKYYASNEVAQALSTTPQAVLDMNNVRSASGFQLCSSAVTENGQLWVWGSGPAYVFGLPEVTGTNAFVAGNNWIWGGTPAVNALEDGSLNLQDTYPYWLSVPSPSQFMTSVSGVKSAHINHALGYNDSSTDEVGDNHIWMTMLKTNGTLWTLGDNRAGQLGRLPAAANDLLNNQEVVFGNDEELPPVQTSYGMVFGQVEIPGNTTNELTPERRIEECVSGDQSVVARCADGTIWGWGYLPCWIVDGFYGRDTSEGKDPNYFDNAQYLGHMGYDGTNYVPGELTSVETWGNNQIVQMSAQGQHYIALRSDGGVAEFGYLASRDVPYVYAEDAPKYYYLVPNIASRYGLNDTYYYTESQYDAWYDAGVEIPLVGPTQTNPIPVVGLPSDVVQVSAAPAFGVALTSKGDVWAWGCLGYYPNEHDETNTVFGDLNVQPHQITSFSNIVKIVALRTSIWAIDKYGALWAWGLDLKQNGSVGLINCGTQDADYTSIMNSGATVESARYYFNAVHIPWVENVANIFDNEDNIFIVGNTIQNRPVGLTAVATSDTNANVTVHLSWTSYSGADHYTLYRSLNPNVGFVAIGTATVNSFNDADPILRIGMTYYYKLAAVVNGVETSPSYQVGIRVSPPPQSVQSLTAVWTCRGAVILDWLSPPDSSTNPPSKLIVARSGVALATLAPGTLSFMDDTIQPGQSSNYTVTVLNNSGQTTSGIVSPTTSLSCAPAPATNYLSVTAGSGGTDPVDVYWSGPGIDDAPVTWLFQGNDFPDDEVEPFITQIKYEHDNSLQTLGGWLWGRIPTLQQDDLLDTSASIGVLRSNLVVDLNQIITVSNDGTNGSVYTADRFASVTLPAITSTLLLTNTTLTGTNLMRVNRLLMDAAYNWNTFFSSAPDWVGALNGFRIHYRAVSDTGGVKHEQDWYQDVPAAAVDLQLENNQVFYHFAAAIPSGAICYVSVSAMVNGEEGELANESLPQSSHFIDNSWNSSSDFQAVPGCNQVYLDWADNDNAASYDVYFSTDSSVTNYPNYATPWSSSSWQLVPGGGGLQVNRLWHTNLALGTYYYALVANNYDDSAPAPQLAAATVVSCPANGQTNFTAKASAYDSMVLIEWTVPRTNATDPLVINQTNWQFYLERKPNATDDTNYVAISDTGFGLSYLDSDVVNGQSYTYRVTAFDSAYNRLQALALDANGSSQISPTPTNGLTLLPPTPGNGYIDLAWSPVRATRFVVNHAMNVNGPFDTIAIFDVQNAYQNAQNTYRHTGLQNGVTNYYQIIATTPTGYELDSTVKGAAALATLPPLPPSDFTGQIIPLSGTNTARLTWSLQTGAARYQVFLKNDTGLNQLFDGMGISCNYIIPDDAAIGQVFTFDIRSMNSIGLPSDLVEIAVTNDSNTTVEAPAAVVLTVAATQDSDALLHLLGPTNLTLNAQVNVPHVDHVDFYADGNLVGSAVDSPYQMVWYHVAGGIHSLNAVAVTSGDYGTAPQVVSSDAVAINILIEPQLSAYQTSATDLQVPAPALPITVSRAYTSRSVITNGVLGVGWTPGWAIASVKLANPLETGWKGVTQDGFASGEYYYIVDAVSHDVTVTLPDGQGIEFGSQVNCDVTAEGGLIDILSDPTISFQPYGVNSGTFSTSLTSLSVDPDEYDTVDTTGWNEMNFSFNTATLSDISYTAPDGTYYQFGQQGNDDLTWLLTKITDRSGNSLNYVYDGNHNLTAITNSCGRQVTFSYSNPQTGVTNISVFDPMGGSHPAVIYVVSNNLLTQVYQLVDRNLGKYLTNAYGYGSNLGGAPADFNRLTDVIDARGVRLLHNTYTNSADGTGYNGDVAVQIAPGRTNTFLVDASYNLTVTATTPTATNTVMVTSDTSGSISGATLPTSGTAPSSTNATQCAYDSQGNLISQTDANGNTKTYTYDDQNRLVGQTDENGNSTSTQLNDYGQATASTDANGNQTTYQYDNAGNPLLVNDPSGTATTYTYSSPVKDGSGKVLVGEMQASQAQKAPFVPYTIVTANLYDTTDPIKGDLLQTTEKWQDASSNAVGVAVTTSYTYDSNGNRLTEVKTRTVSGGGTQSITNAYTYDAQNRVVMTVVSAGGAEILAPQTNLVTYNLLGKQATSTDAAGRVTTNIYDFNGNQIETDYPDGTVSRTAFDSFGRQQYAQDRAQPMSGVTTAPATYNIYDASGRVIRTERCNAVQLARAVANPGADFIGVTNEVQFKMVVNNAGTMLSASRTFYNALGQVQYSVDGRGAVTEYRYDPAGRRTNMLVHLTYYSPTNDTPPSLSDVPLSTVYTYDANGNQLTVTDAAGHTMASVYDSANRVKEMDYPGANGGMVSRYTYYDGLGRKLQESDEAGVATAYSYDFRGLLTSVTLAFGTTQSVTTVYGYDELGNQTQQIDPAGRLTTFKYDALGRKTGRVLPGGQSEGFAYDVAGNQTYQTNFNGVIITNRYDMDNRLTNCSGPGYNTVYAYSVTGLRTNLVDASGTNAYGYDSLNRLTNRLVAWKGGPTVALNYGYDALGSLTNLWSSTANGVSNAYQYDLLGRLTNVTANGSSVAGYGYDAVGNLAGLRYANGVTNLNQYDSRNRLTNSVWRTVSTALALFAYTVAPTGNRTALAETVNGTSHNYTWSYDYLYRLTSEGLGNLGTVNYGFDQAGNRTNRTSSVSGINYQTPTYTANDWLASDTYDTNGNTTASGTANYQYDLLNHLTNVNSGQILFTYDGDGNRMSKTVGGVTTYYLVDDRNPSGYGQVVEEYTGTSLSRVYNYGLALISQRQVSGGAVNYYGVDGHGSVRFLTDGSGTVTDTYQYDAYGLEVGSTGSTPNNYLYSGQQYDPDLGMYYLRARYYKPDTGRFWTMDTYGGDNEDPLSLHKYLYCHSDPIGFADPTGHFEGMIGALGSMSLQMYVRTAIFVAERPIMARVAGLVIGATLMSALEIDPASLQGLPGFQGIGALESGEVKLLAAIKRGPVWDALNASLKGMLSRADGLAFQKFLEKNVFKAVEAVNQRVSQVTKHEVDFVLDNAVVEAKATSAIDEEQLSAIAKYAKDEGKQMWYVFLEKPTRAAIDRIKNAGGKVGWFLDESD